MKQVWPNYSYSPTTNVLTLTGLNIDRDQLLLVTAADRGRIMYNFADSSVTASAFTSGANTALTLVATTAGLTTTAALVIYYDDQVAGSGTVNAVFNSGYVDGMDLLQQVNVCDTVNNLPPISGTITIGSALPNGTNRIGVVTIGAGTVTIGAGTAQIGSVTVGNSVTIGTLPAISGTVTANIGNAGRYDNGGDSLRMDLTAVRGQDAATFLREGGGNVPISGTVTIGAGTSQIGSVTASISNFPATQAVSLTTLPALVAGTAQIGSVTASISGTVPISISSVTVGNSVTIASLPALAAGTAQIGSVTASISNTAITVYSAQGTTVTNSNFTSTTASTTLVSAVAGRDVLTVFNEGAGNLFISPGATATTISYQVRLSAGDYWECPEGQRSLIHTAVFATAGTARVTEVS